jgi:hypothetical protein
MSNIRVHKTSLERLKSTTLKFYPKPKIREGERALSAKEIFAMLIGKANDLPPDLSSNKYQY